MEACVPLNRILEPGFFHAVFICVVGAPAIFHASQALVAVFHFAQVPHRCAIPGLTNDTYEVQDDAHARLINSTIPQELVDGVWQYSQCSIYDGGAVSEDRIPSWNGSLTTVGCTAWVYDTSVFESTATQEMDLVCDRKLLRAHASMLYLLGYLFGALSVGPISDRFGRKKTFCTYMTLEMTMGICQAWAPNFATLSVFRFFTGIGGSGMFVTFFVFVIEFTSPSKRPVFGVGLEYFWATGITLLAVLAYLIRRWRHLQMAISFPSIIFLLYWWKLPESLRWLIQKGRVDEAEKLLKIINRLNKRSIATGDLDSKPENKDGNKNSIWQLVTSRSLVLRTIIVWVNWMMVSMLFYGLALNVQNLGGDLYLNYLLSCLMEIVAYTVSVAVIYRTRRKTFHCSSMLIGGIACVATLFPVVFGGKSIRWLTVTLAMIGRCGGTAAFACIYVFTAELYPTLLRNTAVGSSSVYARVGALLSPYIAQLGDVVETKVGQALPLIVFGGVTIVAGCLALLLPETKDTDLPDTMAEAKKMGRSAGKGSRPAVHEEELQTLKGLD